MFTVGQKRMVQGVLIIAHHPMENLVASHLIVAEAHIGLVLTHLLPPN